MAPVHFFWGPPPANSPFPEGTWVHFSSALPWIPRKVLLQLLLIAMQQGSARIWEHFILFQVSFSWPFFKCLGKKALRMLKTHSLPSSIRPLIYKENTPRECCCSFPPPAGFPLSLKQPHYLSLALSIAGKTGTFAFLVLAERDPVSISLN